ncbi:MAG: oligopeptide transporter, OPT family [Acidobacteriota bacterium]|nr:oligopeptide transporter, OPT family [Acidobacteriota bacterium]
MRELTFLPLLVGTILGIIFGASSLFLVLKVGLTVSASIPVAVISITLFRLASRLGFQNTTILENNIVQTAGSAGESIAFGVGVTMPAIMILGFDLEIGRVLLVSILGGLLGILMMIPLRRALIVEQHGLLKYPEGTACAEVLKAGASREDQMAAQGIQPGSERAKGVLETETGAVTIFTGFAVGLVYKALNVAFKLWKDIPEKIFGAPFTAGSISAEISPELLGVGYIIGPRIAGIMCGGGVLAYLVLIPAIKFFGSQVPGILPPGLMPISQMGPGQIRGAYILYIGAGAVTAGGIISLLRSGGTIWRGLKHGLSDFGFAHIAKAGSARVDRDISMKFVLGGILAMIAVIMLSPSLNLWLNPIGAVLIIIFGFLFVTVSSRLTGEVGSSSNPISGMTIATVLFTCLIFLAIGWTGPSYFVTALSIGGIVCIASSNGGTTSQDLKTGFLIGATPRNQQIAILIGALASAIALGPILLRLNAAATVYVPSVTFEPVTQTQFTDVKPLPFYQGRVQPPTGSGNRLLTLPQAREGLAAGEYVVNSSGKVNYRLTRNFPSDLKAPEAEVGREKERLRGVQAVTDDSVYRVWHNTNDAGARTGRYLVNDRNEAVYLVDPGINGTHNTRPDGSTVTKFDAPKATLVSYIIKGILSQQLPWALVLLGVMIAITLEISGIPSLAFAVGVYLPLSTSSPILFGGLVRYFVDLYVRRRMAGRNLTEAEIIAETDRSPGVLMASGYIAGGAIAGILIAFMAGVLSSVDRGITDWSNAFNPFFRGSYSDALSTIPFIALVILLYLVGREKLLASRTGARDKKA